MTPLNVRLRKSEFDAVIKGKTEIVKYASNKRIHYLCFARMTKECTEKQSACRECFENARACDGYMCYPFDRAIIRRGHTDRRITKELADIYWEEREGKTMFVFKLKNDED
jgi:hypothetical protein